MKVRIGLAVAFAALAVLAVGPTATLSDPGENAVVHWSGVAQSAISAGRPPASSTVLAGMVHGAMYDAVAGVQGGLEPFVTDVNAAAGASADAAVATAARDVLVARVPGQAAAVQLAYDTYMAAIVAGAARDNGIAAGAAAAAGMLAARANDRFDDVVPYVQPTPGPGVFEPIAATPVVDTKLGRVQPFTYNSQSEYRPGPPIDLTSKRYALDLAEVQSIGRAGVNPLRSDFQTETARFFQDQTYVQYSRGVRGIANSQGLDLRESARLLAYVWVSAADTMIACWEAKFVYYFWRPNHAIARADTDGNRYTEPEAGWSPLITGNHPEYPSGHGCITSAVAESLFRYFGTKHVELMLTSTTTGTARTYGKLDELYDDVENARVWGGLHFRTTMTDTFKHFPRIAKDVGKQHFLERD
jgi:hypothetical protein